MDVVDAALDWAEARATDGGSRPLLQPIAGAAPDAGLGAVLAYGLGQLSALVAVGDVDPAVAGRWAERLFASAGLRAIGAAEALAEELHGMPAAPAPVVLPPPEQRTFLARGFPVVVPGPDRAVRGVDGSLRVTAVKFHRDGVEVSWRLVVLPAEPSEAGDVVAGLDLAEAVRGGFSAEDDAGGAYHAGPGGWGGDPTRSLRGTAAFGPAPRPGVTRFTIRLGEVELGEVRVPAETCVETEAAPRGAWSAAVMDERIRQLTSMRRHAGAAGDRALAPAIAYHHVHGMGALFAAAGLPVATPLEARLRRLHAALRLPPPKVVTRTMSATSALVAAERTATVSATAAGRAMPPRPTSPSRRDGFRRLAVCTAPPQPAAGGMLRVVAVELHEDEVDVHWHLEGRTAVDAHGAPPSPARWMLDMELRDDAGTVYGRSGASGSGGDPRATARGVVSFVPGAPPQATVLHVAAGTARFEVPVVPDHSQL